MKLKYLIRIIAFLMVFCICFFVVQNILKKKITKEIAFDNYPSEGFYDEPENSLDILFIGSSHLFSSFSPCYAYEKWGYTSYIRGSSGQRLWMSYYYLVDSLKYQKPKVVVLETLSLYIDEKQYESFNHEAIDGMKFSLTKYNAAKVSIEGNSKDDIIGYMFPLYRYHDRWKEINSEDLKYTFESRHLATKGFFPRLGSAACGSDFKYMSSEIPLEEVPQRTNEYLLKIKELCDENNIELVLVKMPTTDIWDYGKYLGTKKVAEKLSIEFIDYNVNTQEVRIDWRKDTLDGGPHLNYYGAIKITSIFGQYLKENYVLEDKRNNEQYSQWEIDNNFYKQCVSDSEIAMLNEIQQ